MPRVAANPYEPYDPEEEAFPWLRAQGYTKQHHIYADGRHLKALGLSLREDKVIWAIRSLQNRPGPKYRRAPLKKDIAALAGVSYRQTRRIIQALQEPIQDDQGRILRPAYLVVVHDAQLRPLRYDFSRLFKAARAFLTERQAAKLEAKAAARGGLAERHKKEAPDPKLARLYQLFKEHGERDHAPRRTLQALELLQDKAQWDDEALGAAIEAVAREITRSGIKPRRYIAYFLDSLTHAAEEEQTRREQARQEERRQAEEAAAHRFYDEAARAGWPVIPAELLGPLAVEVGPPDGPFYWSRILARATPVYRQRILRYLKKLDTS